MMLVVKKKKKLEQKGGGHARAEDPKGHPTLSPSRTLALSLTPVTPSQPRSLSLTGDATWRCRRPRVTGERKGRTVPPPRVPATDSATVSRPLRTTSPTRPSHQKTPSTHRKSTTHLAPNLSYKLEPRIEPQSASISSKTKVRVSGFRRDDRGSSLKGLGACLLLNRVDY